MMVCNFYYFIYLSEVAKSYNFSPLLFKVVLFLHTFIRFSTPCFSAILLFGGEQLVRRNGSLYRSILQTSVLTPIWDQLD